jgi:hypothetical protein
LLILLYTEWSIAVYFYQEYLPSIYQD